MDVFTEIKGNGEGRRRAFMVFDDFKRACLKYKPECIMDRVQNLPGDRGQNDSIIDDIVLEFYINIVENFYGVVDEDLTGGLGSAEKQIE